MQLAVCAAGGLRRVGGLGGWRFGRLAVWAVGGLGGWRFGRLAVWAVGGLGGWRFGRLAIGGWPIWTVCNWRFATLRFSFGGLLFGGLRLYLRVGGLRLAVSVWWFAFAGLRLAVCVWRFAFGGLRPYLYLIDIVSISYRYLSILYRYLIAILSIPVSIFLDS